MPTKFVKMVAKKSLRYRTRAMQAGEEFDAHGETDARLYQALGYADRAPADVAPPQPPVAAPRAAKSTSRGRWSRPVEISAPVEPVAPVEPSEDARQGHAGSVEPSDGETL